MMQKYIRLIWVGIVIIAITGCRHEEPQPDFSRVKAIKINNRWCAENGGRAVRWVKDKTNREFIFSHLKNFKHDEACSVMTSCNNGYVEIYLGKTVVHMIFTKRNGIVFRKPKGYYLIDDELARRIIQLTEIDNP